MKTVGVIAEYNPFHNGHEYQLTQLKEQTGADYVIAAMGGDFLQRGVPAIVDKYTRADMALSCGADLVLELPALWATASAEYFAQAGVRLLGDTGVVTHLGYGVEQLQPDLLADVCALLCDAPASYEENLKGFQKQGLSYPAAREAALRPLLPQYADSGLLGLLSLPNNILALEYEKALFLHNKTARLPISGFPVPRTGDGYHDTQIRSAYASATAIRERLFQNPKDFDACRVMPPAAAHALLDASNANLTLSEDDFSAVLYAKLLEKRQEGYEAYADCSRDLSRKIQKHLPGFVSWSSFCALLKSKDITYTRISRVLLHILLDIQKERYADAKTDCGYLRVLGFRRTAEPLLAAIKKNASAPLVTKAADAKHLLSEKAYSILELDFYAADLYRGTAAVKSGRALPNEFTQQIRII